MYSGALASPSGIGAEVGRNSRTTQFEPESTRNRSVSNCDVRGLPFLFPRGGCRLVIDANARILWSSEGENILGRANGCIAVMDGRIVGRTRHSERLLKGLLADCRTADRPTQQLLSRAANELPELLVTARSSSRPESDVIALTFRELAGELDGIPDLTRLYGLTPTEHQITGLMLQGMSVTAIAEELNNSVLTVRTHIKRAYVKLNVSSKEQLFSTIVKLMVG